jgi:Uma2 family endonuclease
MSTQAVAQIAFDPEQSAEPEFDPDRKYEIVNGKPEEKEMPGARHSGIAGRLATEIGIYLRSNNIGGLYPEASFQIGVNERIPDLAFLLSERIPPEGEPETKWPIPPDLAIEVISPNDIYEKVMIKTLEYLASGVKQVWLVSPESRMILVYRSNTSIAAFPLESELTCEDLLPDFRLPLGEVFKNPGQQVK